MYTQLRLIQAVKTAQTRQQALATKLESMLPKLPAGHLFYRDGNYYRIVFTGGKRMQIRIPQYSPSGKALIHELCAKRYAAKALPILKRNLKCYDQFLQKFQVYDPAKITEALPSYYAPEFAGILLDGDLDPKLWAKTPYAHNTAFPENLIYQSEGGLSTRSKAEADIATRLEQMGFIFRYEPLLQLGNKFFYPDFCIVHPVHRRLVYWEHFGKMDEPDYSNKTMEKLSVYAEHGYHLGDNLIMTWETKAKPLTFAHINDRIETYFC